MSTAETGDRRNPGGARNPRPAGVPGRRRRGRRRAGRWRGEGAPVGGRPSGNESGGKRPAGRCRPWRGSSGGGGGVSGDGAPDRADRLPGLPRPGRAGRRSSGGWRDRRQRRRGGPAGLPPGGFRTPRGAAGRTAGVGLAARPAGRGRRSGRNGGRSLCRAEGDTAIPPRRGRVRRRSVRRWSRGLPGGGTRGTRGR